MPMQDLILDGIREIWPSEGVFVETDIPQQENMEDRLRRIQDLTAYIGFTMLVQVTHWRMRKQYKEI